MTAAYGMVRWLTHLVLGIALVLPALPVLAQSGDQPFTTEQLDQMTAQVALYPDELLSQLLMATTYPDEFAAAASWSKAHPDAKGDDAVAMVANETWDPSVASLVAFPEVLITLGDKPDWVKNMGDAFLAQPEDVMNSVQRLRALAEKSGNLNSNEQVKVTTEAAPPPAAAPPSVAPQTTTQTTTIQQAPAQTTIVQQPAPPPQIITIEPAQPSVVYVPAYNPAVAYGPWPYPSYPPYYYPPPAGYWFSRTIATGIAWGVGIGISNALWGGFNWGGHDVNINVNRYNNINVNKRLDVNSNRTTWNHNPEHRGQTPYRGGTATRQRLDKQYQAGNREQYRGRDASRDASRARASQTMQNRGVNVDKAAARGKAPNVNRDAAAQRAQNADRDAARQKAQNVSRNPDPPRAANADRDAARQRAQNADRDAARRNAQAANRDNALRGANSTQARAQVSRGDASRHVAQASGGPHAISGGSARAAGGGGGRSGGARMGGRH